MQNPILPTIWAWARHLIHLYLYPYLEKKGKRYYLISQDCYKFKGLLQLYFGKFYLLVIS